MDEIYQEFTSILHEVATAFQQRSIPLLREALGKMSDLQVRTGNAMLAMGASSAAHSQFMTDASAAMAGMEAAITDFEEHARKATGLTLDGNKGEAILKALRVSVGDGNTAILLGGDAAPVARADYVERELNAIRETLASLAGDSAFTKMYESVGSVGATTTRTT